MVKRVAWHYIEFSSSFYAAVLHFTATSRGAYCSCTSSRRSLSALMSSSRVLNPRKLPRLDYKKLNDVTLPSKRPSAKCQGSKLYPVEVLEVDNLHDRMKIHYVGYDESFDEWREVKDNLEYSTDESHSQSETAYAPFSLYFELGTKIKVSLLSKRKESPNIRLEVPFDKLLYEGGLKSCGRFRRTYRGIQRYGIAKYSDLNPLLGVNWHYRGLNDVGDFCFVILETVEYYIFKRAPIIEYIPAPSGVVAETRQLGWTLIFTFQETK